MKTEKFIITMGVKEGYNTNFTEEDLLKEQKEYCITRIKVQNILKEIYDATGVYVSCYSNMSSTIYHQDWGCPLSGEGTITLSGTCNTSFVELYKWHATVILFADKLKEAFKQSTITIEFLEANIEYLN